MIGWIYQQLLGFEIDWVLQTFSCRNSWRPSNCEKDFDIIGSAVNVYNTTNGFNRGLALDAALRIPLPDSFTPSIIKKAKLSLGGFRAAGKTRWNPTYSLDFEF